MSKSFIALQWALFLALALRTQGFLMVVPICIASAAAVVLIVGSMCNSERGAIGVAFANMTLFGILGIMGYICIFCVDMGFLVGIPTAMLMGLATVYSYFEFVKRMKAAAKTE